MDSFKQFIAENANPSITPTLIEYMTRKVFTTKNIKRAAGYTHKQFNGTSNMFLGKNLSFTVDELIDAYYTDKAKTIKTKLATLPAEKHEKRLEVECAYFSLDPATLKRYMDKV